MSHWKHLAGCVVLGSLSAAPLLAWHPWRSGACPDPVTTADSSPQTPPASEIGSRIRFRDLARAAGIRFEHSDGRTPMHYFPEVMGGGAAWLDYDQDGYLDLLLVQGGRFPPGPDQTPAGPTSRLYRNQGDGTFVDVTAQVGLLHAGYGPGVAVGDNDNDGYAA